MFNNMRIACSQKSQRRRKYREFRYLRAFKAPLHSSRELYKSNLFLQNKANSPSVQYDTTTLSIRSYKILCEILSPKNKAKQSQFKPNFQCNCVKMGNIECEILSECVILLVLYSLSFVALAKKEAQNWLRFSRIWLCLPQFFHSFFTCLRIECILTGCLNTLKNKAFFNKLREVRENGL